MISKEYLKQVLYSVIIALVVMMLSFRTISWSYSVGIDMPLIWVFNHGFDQNIALLQEFIFPHGPLAFLMYPLPENLWCSLFVTFCLKVILVYGTSALINVCQNWRRYSIAFLIVFFISISVGINHLILCNAIILYCLRYRAEKTDVFLGSLILILTILAIYVKAYVAILMLCLFFSFQFYQIVFHRSFRNVMLETLVLMAGLILFWLLLFQSFHGFADYFFGMFQLAGDNSTAVALYPYNNWWILSIWLISLFLLAWFNWNKRTFFFIILTILSLFAAWKHGMAREDISHIRGHYEYLGICLLVFVLFQEKSRLINFLIAIFSLSMFYINMKNAHFFNPPKYDFTKVRKFVRFINAYDSLIESAKNHSSNNISQNTLSKDVLQEVADATIDVYPWDYSFIPANDLNWQPRRIIHSYASYSRWLDQQNAEHFRSSKAPQFILWELDKMTRDINGTRMHSIDNRYLLNDEPNTIYSLLSHYELSIANSKLFLLKKRESEIKLESVESNKFTASMGDWVSVPKSTGDVLRAKLFLRKSWLQRMKSTLYKDEQFWLYYRVTNGLIHKYRIVPNNARDGIWINPYLTDLKNSHEVEAIMLQASNRSLLENEFEVKWEYISNLSDLDSLFFDGERIDTTGAKFPYPLKTISGEIPINVGSAIDLTNDTITLPKTNIRISAGVWLKGIDYKFANKGSIEIIVLDKEKELATKSIHLGGQTIDPNEWNHTYHFLDFKNDLDRELIIQVKLTNETANEFMLKEATTFAEY